MSLKSDFSIKQCLCFICTYLTCLLIVKQLSTSSEYYTINPFGKNSYSIFSIMFLIKRVSIIICIPYTAYYVIATFFKDKKDNKIETEITKMTTQKVICFRVVTRGMFPELIIKNRDYNLSVINGFEKLKYTYEVVTDKRIGDIDTKDNCYELVVPDKYSPKNGAKYKARALQFAIEHNLSNLGDNDIVVHLDEETQLTESCIIGIVNFANENKHHIGQGE